MLYLSASFNSETVELSKSLSSHRLEEFGKTKKPMYEGTGQLLFSVLRVFRKTTSTSAESATKRECKQKYYICYCSGLISAPFCEEQ